jgi:hypothetical protein
MFHETLEVIVDGDPSHFDHINATLTPLLEAWRQIPVGSAEREIARRAGGDVAAQDDPQAQTGPDPASAAEDDPAIAQPQSGPRPYPNAPESVPADRQPLLSVSA